MLLKNTICHKHEEMEGEKPSMIDSQSSKSMRFVHVAVARKMVAAVLDSQLGWIRGGGQE